ncbi:MAG: hypothetical protein ACM3RX_05070 [Methanococcaceae archaeon]
MSKFKDLMQLSVDKSPIDLKTTQNFPPYWFYDLDIIRHTDAKTGYGLKVGYYSTGARNHYADYSGSYREDMKLSSINIGFLVSQREPIVGNFFGTVELGTGAKFSMLQLENEINISSSNQSLTDEYNNLGWWAEPQVRIGRKMGEKYVVSLFAGYEFTVINNINIKAIHAEYYGPDINWSGLRAGISFSVIDSH